MKLPNFCYDIAKAFTPKNQMRPSIDVLHIGNWYIEATDVYSAIRIKTKLEGDFSIHKDHIIKNVETETNEENKTYLPFPETKDFYKNNWEYNYTTLNIDLLINKLKWIKAMGNTGVRIKVWEALGIVIIESTNYDKAMDRGEEFEAILMPLKD